MTPAKQLKIGILQTGKVPAELVARHGHLPSMFERILQGHGFAFQTWSVIDDVFPADVHECDGWLITGSPHGAYDDLPWIGILEQFIRDAYRAEVPVAGICFGHQLMAQALGGKVEKFAGGWGAGHMRYRMKDGREITINAMHQDQVVVRPPDAEVICSSDFCEYAGLAYKGPAISFQPHPEFDDAYMTDLLSARSGKSIPKERADAALESLGADLDSQDLANRIAEFFKASVRQPA